MIIFFSVSSPLSITLHKAWDLDNMNPAQLLRVKSMQTSWSVALQTRHWTKNTNLDVATCANMVMKNKTPQSFRNRTLHDDIFCILGGPNAVIGIGSRLISSQPLPPLHPLRLSRHLLMGGILPYDATPATIPPALPSIHSSVFPRSGNGRQPAGGGLRLSNTQDGMSGARRSASAQCRQLSGSDVSCLPTLPYIIIHPFLIHDIPISDTDMHRTYYVFT